MYVEYTLCDRLCEFWQKIPGTEAKPSVPGKIPVEEAFKKITRFREMVNLQAKYEVLFLKFLQFQIISGHFVVNSNIRQLERYFNYSDGRPKAHTIFSVQFRIGSAISFLVLLLAHQMHT